MMQQLSHENVVRLRNWFSTNEGDCTWLHLVMDFMPCTLRSLQAEALSASGRATDYTGFKRDLYWRESKRDEDEKEEKENGGSKSEEKEDRRKSREEKVLPATILSVEGRNYSVDVYYLADPCPDYVRACVDTCVRLHEQEPPGDVLIFLTGMEEVDHCCTLLKQYRGM